MKPITYLTAAAIILLGIATGASAQSGDNWENGAGYGSYYGEFLETSIYVRSQCTNESQSGCFRIYPPATR